jgi:hypothetical protein
MRNDMEDANIGVPDTGHAESDRYGSFQVGRLIDCSENELACQHAPSSRLMSVT